MRRITMTLAAASALALAAPALAVQYRFDVFDPTANDNGALLDNGAYNFFFDSSPMPTIFTSDTFSLSGTIFYSVGGSARTIASAFDFLTAGSGGALNTQFNQYVGDQLFTGDTSDPTFRLGPFVLDAGTITISVVGGSTSPVPEPAAWATMIAGFGMMGAMLRTRRPRVRFAI